MSDEHIDEPRSSRPMTFLAAAGWTVGTMFLSSLLMAMTESVRPEAASDLVNITACKVVAYSALVFTMLRLYAPNASIRDVLGLRAVSPLAALLALAGGVLLCPGLSLIDDAIYKRFPLAAEETELLDKLTQVTSIHERVLLVATFVIVIPLADELFFNGIVFRGLRRGQSEGLAILGSAILYALSHGDWRALPSGLVLGLLAAWLRGRSGSLVPSVLAHVALNAVPLVPIALGKGEIDFGPRVAVGGVVLAAFCAWGAGMVFRGDERAEEGRLADA